MQSIVEYILRNITDFPDDIVVEEQKSDENRINYVVTCNPADLPRVIGKQGRIIRAIRDIVKISATKNNLYVDVILKDSIKP